jgi:hypothetical protein
MRGDLIAKQQVLRVQVKRDAMRVIETINRIASQLVAQGDLPTWTCEDQMLDYRLALEALHKTARRLRELETQLAGG